MTMICLDKLKRKIAKAAIECEPSEEALDAFVLAAIKLIIVAFAALLLA